MNPAATPAAVTDATASAQLSPPPSRLTFVPQDRMTALSGTLAMSGIDALLRILVDQRLADISNGLATAALLCGYRGSPLGGVDAQYARYESLLSARDIRFINGVNEELAATIIWGSQLSSNMSGALFDGVMGMWYGKAPGVDRAGDAFRHANMSGTARWGGVLCVAGDDPACKSSTLPSASEAMLSQIPMPVIYPGSVQEILDYGRWGYELSRACGLWVGFKIVTDLADAYATVEVGPDRVQPVARAGGGGGAQWQPEQNQQLLPPWVLDIERDLRQNRLAEAVAFARRNGLTQLLGAGFEGLGGGAGAGLAVPAGAAPTTAAPTTAWLGIVSAGKNYYDVCEALSRLGIDESGLSRLGIRLMKPAMIWPLEPEAVRQFSQGLREILVVEEKSSFIESQLRDILYHQPQRPDIFGKTDTQGQTLFPQYGYIEADQVTSVIADLLVARLGAEILNTFPRNYVSRNLFRTRIPVRGAEQAFTSDTHQSSLPVRAPYYCSGCPHNRSNVTPEGSITLGGIGCHSMSLFIPTRQVEGLTQMGGEGGTWVGAAPFVSDSHRFQNLGDGTLFHSGSLAIRQAVASGVNITFKILYNSVVAMTGGQSAAGEASVPDLTMLLAAEGVRRTIVVADDIEKYPANTIWAANVDLRPRTDIEQVQRELREVAGTTALIYDQACSADLRKKRRRRLVEPPSFRVVINERVCEGCGDCARVSNCLSVFPVMTELGEKTRIHQESCNQDFTCMEGNCPSFVKVKESAGRQRRAQRRTERRAQRQAQRRAQRQTQRRTDSRGDHHLRTMGERGKAAQELFADATRKLMPEPSHQLAEAELLLAGIGGTGVVTVSQILATAALLDGKHCLGLDQTGLSQKGGQVISNLKVTLEPREVSSRVGAGQADVLLLFDQLAAADDVVLNRAEASRTVASVSTSVLPTGEMITDAGVSFPDVARLRERIEGRTVAAQNCWVDAESLSRLLFKSQPPANVIVVGAAYQSGHLPVSAASIEEAIEINGVAAQVNLTAFRLGRALVAEPGLQDRLLELANPATGSGAGSGVGAGAGVGSGAGAGAGRTRTAGVRRRVEFQIRAQVKAMLAADFPAAAVGAVTATADTGAADTGAADTGAADTATPPTALSDALELRALDLAAYQSARYALRYLSVIQKIRHHERQIAGADTTLSLSVAKNLHKLMAYKDEYEVARLHLLPETGDYIRDEFSSRARRSYLLQPPIFTKLGLAAKISIPHWLGAVLFRVLRAMRRVRGTALDVFGYAGERRLERKLILDYIDMMSELSGQLSEENFGLVVEIAGLADVIRGYDTVKLANVEKYMNELTVKLSQLLDTQPAGRRMGAGTGSGAGTGAGAGSKNGEREQHDSEHDSEAADQRRQRIQSLR